MRKYTVIVMYPHGEGCYVEHVTTESLKNAEAQALEACSTASGVDAASLSVDFILDGHQDIEYRRDFDGEL